MLLCPAGGCCPLLSQCLCHLNIQNHCLGFQIYLSFTSVCKSLSCGTGALFLDGGLQVVEKIFGRTLFGDDNTCLRTWQELPLHPLQEDEPGGDRHWIESSPTLQVIVLVIIVVVVVVVIVVRLVYSLAGQLFVGCLTSQQHASVSQGRICSDNFACCHTEKEVAGQTFHLIQSHYTDTRTTSPSTDPIMPGTWRGSHWSANF